MEKLRFLGRYILIPILFIILLFSFYIVYKDIRNRTIREFTDNQFILAETAAQGMSAFFLEYKSDLEFLAQIDEIKEFSDDAKTLMTIFYNEHKSILAATTRVDSNGVILYTCPENKSVIGNSIIHQDHVKKVISTHKAVISDVFLSAQGYNAIALHVPVFKNGRFTGSLAILVPIDRLGELYLGNIDLKGNNEAWLLSQRGISLYCPNKNHAGKPFPELVNSDERSIQLLDRISKNNSGTAIINHQESDNPDESVEKYVTFYRMPIGNTYWTILISVHEKAIYQSLTRLNNRLILLFAVFLLIVGFYVYSIVEARNVLREESKRKKAEKTLKESEEKFRRLFEEHTAIKLIIDPGSGQIADANKSAASYYGWTREELRNLKIQEINTLPPEDIIKGMQKVLAENKAQFEFRHRKKDGTIHDVEVFSSKIMIGDKNMLHSIIHDITDRKIIEKELVEAKEHAEESDRLKTAFLQNMSHEIRTPMNAIMGFSSLIADYYDNKPKLERFAEIINTRCNDLLEIINGILDISKIESGQINLKKEECNLNELFAELLKFFDEHRIRLGKKHITIDMKASCRPSETIIIADTVKLRQIFMNLIGNALKYTRDGAITAGCKEDENGRLLFFVSDTGIGIPEDKRHRVFERFVQLHDDDNSTYSGTGLGLAIVKGLVDLMEGKIWFESEAGKGTTFYFTISY